MALPRCPFAVPLVVGLLLFAGLAGWGALGDSQTWDEAMSVAAGFRRSDLGDDAVLWENPPLLGWLVYAPYRLAGVRHPVLPAGAAATISPFEYGRLFLYEAGNPHRHTLLLARGAVLAVSLAAVAVVIWWASLLHGLRGAWIAALWAGCEPSWLAHGRTAAFDGLATATIVLALFGCARLLERPSWGRALAAGALVGLALASKHTALVLLPMVLALGGLASLPGGATWLAGAPPGAAMSRWRRAGQWLVVLLVAMVVLGLTYGGTFDHGQYLRSVAGTYRLARSGYDSYLLGRFRDGPFPHYYLVAAAVKTPVAWLALLPLGLVATLRRRPRALWVPAAVLIVLLLVVTGANPRNLGYRHFLPAVPMLALIAAGAAGPLARRGLGWVAIALALVGGAESVAQAPQHLAFFNVLAGGPDRGIEVLDESNIDWGQDLLRLAELQRTERIEDLALLYFGTAVPAAHGVRARAMEAAEFERPRPGTTYAISVHILNRLPRLLGRDPEWLRHRPAWRKAGRSIYLYRF